jgi:hypothetical protein
VNFIMVDLINPTRFKPGWKGFKLKGEFKSVGRKGYVYCIMIDLIKPTRFKPGW